MGMRHNTLRLAMAVMPIVMASAHQTLTGISAAQAQALNGKPKGNQPKGPHPHRKFNVQKSLRR